MQSRSAKIPLEYRAWVAHSMHCIGNPSDGIYTHQSRQVVVTSPLHSLPPQISQFYFLGSNPRPTRNTCPSGCRRCISRTFHGISVGGNVISSPAAMQCLYISSTSSTQTDIQTPLSPSSSPSC